MERQNYLVSLRLFNEKYEKLRSLSFYRKVFKEKTGVTVSRKAGEPVKVLRRGPKAESIDAFVLTFRFFIQDNEKSSFRNIAEVYENLPISQQKKELFKNSRTNLNAFLDSPSMFKIIDESPTRRDILETFIYGNLAHANKGKKETYDQWMSYPAFNQLIINEFVFILGIVMNFITYVKNLNDEVIKELRD
ncbi:MAG: hypothetical protein ACFFCW_38595 [Candidatus Hodarchaeota archaeon]